MSDDWTDDIEEILSKVRQNCIDMYKYHLCRYFQYKRVLPIFRVPVLILNALNSVFSVGLQPYMEQSLISVLNCFISLIATIINSIEMYMGIQKSMESEMSSSQGFYILSIGIYKMLTLTRENRDINGKQYLMECYNTYSELVRNSKLIKDPYMLQKDFLQNVDKAIGGIRPESVANAGNEYIMSHLDNAEESLKEMALKTMSTTLPPILPNPLEQPATTATDIEMGTRVSQLMPNLSVNGSSSPYPMHLYHHASHNHHHYNNHHNHTQPPHHPHQHTQRTSFTSSHDPLYSLSRKGIFGGIIKKNDFLEMAGVDLGDPVVDNEETLTQNLGSNIKQLFSNTLHNITHSLPPSQTATPEGSYHTHLHQHQHQPNESVMFPSLSIRDIEHPSINIILERELSTSTVIEEKEDIPPPSPPITQPNQPITILQPKVKDIIQEIESKPKKETPAPTTNEP